MTQKTNSYHPSLNRKIISSKKLRFLIETRLVKSNLYNVRILYYLIESLAALPENHLKKLSVYLCNLLNDIVFDYMLRGQYVSHANLLPFAFALISTHFVSLFSLILVYGYLSRS